MTDEQIAEYRAELLREYPGARVKVVDDRKEMVAEFDGYRAIAVVEHSQPHFHRKTKEVYKVLRGTLHVACGGRGHLMTAGDSLTIEPGNIHFARAAGAPAWVEVLCEPAWTIDDHLLV
jgi:mannose-6-phosphate isomerase-like protein (cupin superfamily)